MLSEAAGRAEAEYTCEMDPDPLRCHNAEEPCRVHGYTIDPPSPEYREACAAAEWDLDAAEFDSQLESETRYTAAGHPYIPWPNAGSEAGYEEPEADFELEL